VGCRPICQHLALRFRLRSGRARPPRRETYECCPRACVVRLDLGGLRGRPRFIARGMTWHDGLYWQRRRLSRRRRGEAQEFVTAAG
jgi:hypothetical protein